ncbi:MAG: hypothetical protein B6D63_07355 [Candidatus Latescibacteria bacterium 4484_7]|nr:MAG: hypothetical protein B6D63_07355 [Candidatus Latescibacteria bacterium 4484_7]
MLTDQSFKKYFRRRNRRSFAVAEGSKKKQLIAKRKNQIIRAAIREFSNRGFHETEMDNIARTAGVSKGTLYNYFENKSDLFLSTIDWGLSRLIGKVYKSLEGINDPVLKLEKALEVYLDYLRKNKSLFKILYRYKDMFREDMKTKFGKRHSAHFYLLEDILNDGIEKGIFRRFNAKSASLSIAGGIMHSLMQGELELKNKKSVAEQTKQFKELVFYGIMKRDGTETNKQKKGRKN